MHVGGEGSVLVLLHGICGTWEIWKPVLPALEARHQVIAMTLPGHYGGAAYVGPGDATVAGVADQIVASLRSLGIESAHVAGNSFGGWLAIELARRRFARSVVAFSPAGGWSSDHDYRAIARSFSILYSSIDLLRLLSSPIIRYARVRKLLARQTMEHGDRVPEPAFRAFLTAMSNCEILPGLLRTMGRDGPIAAFEASMPIRIAWCDRDRVIPFSRYGESFVKRVRGAELTMVHGAGHVPLYDDPEQIVEKIVDVTSSVDSASVSYKPLQIATRYQSPPRLCP